MKKIAPLIFQRLLLILAALLIAVTGSTTAYFAARNTDKAIRASLVKRAETVAAALDGNLIAQLSGSIADLKDGRYITLKHELTNVQNINSDVRFVYVFGIKNDKVFFYADSEPANSLYYSPPGQAYGEASSELLQAFKDGHSFVEGPVDDRWGSWLSALAPVYTAGSVDGKKTSVILGMDISNSDRRAQIAGVILMISALTVLAEIALLLSYLYWRHKRKAKAAEELHKMKELQYEFVSMISHQLRTPITSARAIVEILKDEKELKTLDDAYKKINHLNNIVSTLLFFIENKNVFGQKKALTEKKADLVSVVKNQLELLKNEIVDKRNVIEAKLPETLILSADEVLLNRIVYCLIQNAIIYNKDYGTIKISIEGDAVHPILAVVDSGYGVPAKEQKEVFNPFFRATNASLGLNEGSGLSLYITREIMRLIGGRVTFTSVEGEGSTFFLYF